MLGSEYLALLKNEAEKFNIKLSDKKLDKFSTYAKLLIEWNEKINLTAITDEEGITIKHFLDSLSVFQVMPENAATVIDVGTGAGFPGVPMKIADDKLKVTLLDSLAKRVNFLEEVLKRLSLKDIEVFHGRAEDFGIKKDFREQFDIAVARAVAALPVLLEYCLPFVKLGGTFIAMKGPDIKEELKESQKALKVLGGEIVDVREFTLYNSENKRCIVMIKKYRQTPSNYPRKSGKPTKSPIK